MAESEKRGIESVSGVSGDTTNVKRKKFNDSWFRLLFHQESVGRVIGRNGDNLKNARANISAKAHLRVPEHPPSVLNKDRILMVSCELTDVSRLMHQLAPSIWHALDGSPNRELNLLVPSDVAGAVLGKGGSRLKELREEHGCRVTMFKDKLPFSDERVVEIQGKEGEIEPIVDTLISILTILQERPLQHDFIRYAPLVCSDQDYLNLNCGGYMKQHVEAGGGGGSGKLSMTLRPDGQLDTISRTIDNDQLYKQGGFMVDSFNAYNQGFNGVNSALQPYNNLSIMGDGMMWNTTSDQYKVPPPDPSNNFTSHSAQLDAHRRASPPRHHSTSRRSPPRGRSPPQGRSPPRVRSPARHERNSSRTRSARSPPPPMIVDDFMNEDISKDIMVDDKLTSSIIGPKGSRIKAIRNRTSAMIKISEDSAVVDEKRKISISGTMKEVMWAVNAVRTLIKDAEDEIRHHSRDVPMDSSADLRQRRDSHGMSSGDLPNSRLFDMARKVLPFEPSNDRSDEKITQSVKIASKNAGQVLGRKASIINEIRKMSRCQVLVAKECDAGTDERSVTITGTPRDVHIAEYMVSAVQQMPRDVPQQLGLV